MIVVTGATGQLGSLIVHRLLDRVPAEQVAVSVRDPDRAADLASRGVRVRRGDFADPGSLSLAFEDADQVLVVSVDRLGDEAVAQHKSAIDAAYDAGARRVLYTSHQAASPDSVFAPARDHAETEAHLAASGRPHTVLRDGFHAATVPHLVGDAAETGELLAPADGPVSWTTHADLAEGAAAVLADASGRPDADVVTLTAAEAVDLEQVAVVLTELTGRTIRRVAVDDDEFVALKVASGVPEPGARMFLTMFDAARRGEFAAADPALEDLLGRPPQGIRDVLEGAATR